MALSTGFKKVAQSGKTIDGREIKPEWLLDAAETYSTDIYTASIFEDHNENYGSLGTVKALKAETDKNGVVSLFADIQPNAFWQSDSRYGQNLFTSVALMPNFAGTGKWYMQHLAATNSPASLGVEKLEFSKKEPTTLFSAAFDTKQAESNNEPTQEEVVSFFSRLFKTKPQGNQDMADDKALKELQTKFSALETELSALKADKKDDKPADDSAKFSALEKENTELKIKVADLEKQNTEFSTKFDTLNTQFTELKTTLDDALKEDPSKGTKDSKEFGASNGKDEAVFA